MASGSPDLFVVCKHCGAEVSPYITECPYCGQRLQKRAPKLNRDGQIEIKAPKRQLQPSLPRLRRGEIPGIRHDSHPYAIGLLVALGFIGTLLWRSGAVEYPHLVAFSSHSLLASFAHAVWWHDITAAFVYDNTGYAVLTLGVIAIFGTLMERHHGPVVVLALFLLGAVGGTVLSLQVSNTSVFDGANGAAVALVVAWAIPHLIELAAEGEAEGDLIAAAVLGLMIVLMPLVAPEASWLSGAVGVAAGIVIGYPVARLHPV